MDINNILIYLLIFNGFQLLISTFILVILTFFYSRVKAYEFTRKIQNSVNDKEI